MLVCLCAPVPRYNYSTPHTVCLLQVNELCKMISDLSLEYCTVHARLLQRKERRKRKTGGLIPFVRAQHTALLHTLPAWGGHSLHYVVFEWQCGCFMGILCVCACVCACMRVCACVRECVWHASCMNIVCTYECWVCRGCRLVSA